MTNETISLEDFMHAMPVGLGSVPLASVYEAHRDAIDETDGFDPFRLAATFAGLLTVSELQSNCIRLEALVHLSLARAKGSRKPSDTIVTKLFSELGQGQLGMQEDPAEDVFVSSIQTPRGNFRILEGIWESSGFHLQRFVDALERIPAHPRYDAMRESVYALLAMSEVVCDRANLERYQLGNEIPQEALPGKIIVSLSRLRRVVRFPEASLVEHGIDPDDIAVFGFIPDGRSGLIGEVIGDTTLERHPVAYRNGDYVLMMPTAVSVAIRRFVIEKMEEYGLRETFARTLAFGYGDFFADTPLLGSRSGAPIEFRLHEGVLVAGAMMKADRGLYLNYVFFADTLEGFENGGMMGAYPHDENAALDKNIETWIDQAYAEASKQADFRECITVLVGCGVGRALTFSSDLKKRDRWRYVMMSAPDLFTLSWAEGFGPLSLWRLLDSREKLREMNVTLHNINGLLNIVAWARSLGGHLIPHGDIPHDVGTDDRPFFVMVEQNALRNLRHEVMSQWSSHVACDIEGNWCEVQRDGRPFFEEDRNRPFFVTDGDAATHRWPRGVYETPDRWWWFQFTSTPDTSGSAAYIRHMMLKTWLCRIAPVLDASLPNLPEGALQWRLDFKGTMGNYDGQEDREYSTFDDALKSLTFTVSDGDREIVIEAAPEFELALFHPENIAERALVTRTVEAFTALSRAELSSAEIAALVDEIVQNASARQSHAFRAISFRDYVQDSVRRTPIKVDADDFAYLRLGLRWRHRKRSEGNEINGREECMSFLSTLVRELEDEVCADLRQIDKRAALMFALENHESAIVDREQWRRTAAAVLALHSDKEATLGVMADHDSELNAIFRGTRLLIEFAICECPSTGGRVPGKLDMSRIMSKLLTISSYGGWSDAIRWEAMPPRLRVTALGDVQAHVGFQEEILAPYARAGSDVMIKDAAENYAKNLEQPPVHDVNKSQFEPAFLEAIAEQYGAAFATLRKFIDKLEDMGLEQKAAIFTIKKSELLSELKEIENADPNEIERVVQFLSFVGRPHWRELTEGYDERDRFPWRFRRRLSVLRLPLIHVDDSSDPDIIVAPGVARDGFVYSIRNYHRGDFPVWQLSPKMREWSGRSRNKIGNEFSQSVADKLKELGWNVEVDVPVTKLLGKGSVDGFGDLKTYGDVDVLAWRTDRGRVLLNECKDVQHRKVEGEIAEQLADFRGELRPDGKPDYLLRHLNRLKVISAHPKEVAAYIKSKVEPKIEAHLIFKNPVPMQFALKRMEALMPIHVFAGLEEI